MSVTGEFKSLWLLEMFSEVLEAKDQDLERELLGSCASEEDLR